MKTPKALMMLAAIATMAFSNQLLASGLTLRNDIPSPGQTAEFRVLQGTTPIARVNVKAGESATIPTSNCYRAQATTTLGNFTVTSNTVSFCEDSVNLKSQVMVQNGFFDFELVQERGSLPKTFRLENTWREPAQFKIQTTGTPFELITVVEKDHAVLISTAVQYSIYAIVNGITTSAVTTDNRNATIILIPDNNDDGYRLLVL